MNPITIDKCNKYLSIKIREQSYSPSPFSITPVLIMHRSYGTQPYRQRDSQIVERNTQGGECVYEGGPTAFKDSDLGSALRGSSGRVRKHCIDDWLIQSGAEVLSTEENSSPAAFVMRRLLGGESYVEN